MVVFCGSFSYLLEMGGGARVFADTLASKIKGRSGAQVMAALGGTIIFFSDSTNPVLIGPVFKPLTDKMKVSREKLAYIVDATSATMPSMFFFTAWGAYILSIMNQQFESIGYDANGIVMFNRAVPFMFYTVGAVILVYFIAITGFDFGPMERAEKRAQETGKVIADEDATEALTREVVIPEGATPKLSSMVVPLIVLVVFIFGGLLFPISILAVFLFGGRIQNIFAREKIQPQVIFSAPSTAQTLPLIAKGLAASYCTHMNLVAGRGQLDSHVNIFPLWDQGAPVEHPLSLLRHRQRYLTHFAKYFMELLFQTADSFETTPVRWIVGESDGVEKPVEKV